MSKYSHPGGGVAIDAESLARMKRGVMIINTGRGALITWSHHGLLDRSCGPCSSYHVLCDQAPLLVLVGPTACVGRSHSLCSFVSPPWWSHCQLV